MKHMEINGTREILRKVRAVEIRTNRLVNDTLAGQYHSVFKGRGINFDEVREYVPGDDVRSIDWNVTARTGKPHVKKYTEERELTILLLIDVSASEAFGSGVRSKRELVAELGSVLAFSAIRNNDKVGLILFTDDVELYIPPAKGRSHVLRVIRELLFFEPAGRRTNIAAALDFANHVMRRRAVTFLISDFCHPRGSQVLLEPMRAKLRITNRHHDVVAVSVNDPREFELPDIGRLSIEDAETGEQVELDTSDKDVRSGFAALARTRRSILRHAVRSAGVDFLELSTDREYVPELIGFFNLRERRRSR
jgi:uncharacterized protein (DUF58 family)